MNAFICLTVAKSIFFFFPHTVLSDRPDRTPPMAVFDPLAVSFTPLGYLRGG